jgi:hypothetical protein
MPDGGAHFTQVQSETIIAAGTQHSTMRVTDSSGLFNVGSEGVYPAIAAFTTKGTN